MIKVDGNKLAGSVLQELEQYKLKDLSLGIVQVGKNPISTSFIKKKQDIAQRLGINCPVFTFEKSISNRQLRKQLAILAKDNRVHGILIQLPLPKNINTQYILDSVPIIKDVDVLSSKALGNFYTGKCKIKPPIVAAVLRVMEEYNIKIISQEIVLIGNGRLVGKPLSIELARKKATVSILNSKTQNIDSFTRKADVVISGAGQPKLVNASMLKKGSIVIDAGLSNSLDEKIQGDIEPKNLAKKVKIFVPAKGGLGPITVAMVMQNMILLNN
jgi:methylenetetrahydrofolate dehydrogenase (NADP+) / methenyltetrahydrofolate cyclohydrolase